MTTKRSEILNAISNVVHARRQRGATVQELCRYLDHLSADTWHTTPAIIAEIAVLKKEISLIYLTE